MKNKWKYFDTKTNPRRRILQNPQEQEENNEIGYICEDCEMSLSMHFMDSLGSDDYQTSGEQTPSLLDTTFTFTVSVLF